MSAGIRKLKLVRDDKHVRPDTSISSTTYHIAPKADLRVLRSEARALFVRFAIRWCQARSESQVHKGVA